MEKYLVVYDTYLGKYYNGEFTRVYNTYEEMIKAINENSITLKVKRVYKINEELEIGALENGKN